MLVVITMRATKNAAKCVVKMGLIMMMILLMTIW